MKNVKILFNEKGEYGQELAIAINDKIVSLDNMFDNTLGEHELELKDYTNLDILEKINMNFVGLVDCYCFETIESIEKIYQDAYSREIEKFTLLEEKDIETDILANIIKKYTNDYIKKHQEQILEKLHIN